MSILDVRRYLNDIPDKRVARIFLNILDKTAPTGDNVNLTAYAGGGQTDALLLSAACAYHEVGTVATADDSVALPVPDVGDVHIVNNSATNSMQVFGVDPVTIDGVATATGVPHPGKTTVVYACVERGNYVRVSGVASAMVAALSGITAGVAAANKAVVLGAAKEVATLGQITTSEPIVYDAATTITAFGGGGQGSATALTAEFNNVTVCATAGDSVKLPAAALGKRIRVKNSGATSLAVFPATDDSINALAANLSVNIPVGGEMTFSAISGVVWETNEVFTSPAPTTQRGEFVFKASDNAADHEIVFTNASHGQATTHTVPDGGAATDYGVYSTAAITLVEADVLDGATQGAGVASKAVVLDSNGDFKMADGDLFKLSADTLAAAGSTPANSAALTDQINIVTGADGAKGVVLPAAADLLEYTISNDSPTYALKVWPANGGDDVINELAADEAFILGPGRSATFKAISATQWYADKDAANSTKETHFEVFDDFLDAALDSTNNWITFDGTTAAAQPATTVTAPEGQVTMINGAANDANDKTVTSLILLAKGSLISLGKTVFETRVSFSAVTGCSWGFGLGDVLANATEVANYTVNSGVVADDGGIANAVSFVFDTDATAPTKWQMASTNAGTVGNAGAEEALASGPSANTYATLRIEVDSSGDARFYVNGVLEGSRATAVATTALLIPYIWGDSAVDAQTAVTVAIDYIKFQGARPSSNA